MLLAMPISWKGTLAQYAGRLHRSYEGKREVRIYDYVDVHVPALERMYHKRLRGYSELGYQVKLAGQDDIPSRIFNSSEYAAAFAEDLTNAARSVRIVSPFLQKGRVAALLPALKNAVTFGVEVAVYTRPPESYRPNQQPGIAAAVSLLKETGAAVMAEAKYRQRCAIMDESIVWYGGIDFLAFGKKGADVLRFENADIAGELLDAVEEPVSEDVGEQLSIRAVKKAAAP